MSSFADQPVPGTSRARTISARVEELYGSHIALVRAICRSLLRDSVEAEDAVQQTFLSAHRALLNGSSPRESAAWLATIARHESLARVRARMRDPLPVETEERAGGLDAHAAAVRSHEAGELRDALAELPAQQREAILLREVRGLSYEEVAGALSVTTPAVESLLFRARRTLQSRLREALATLAGPAAAKVAALGAGTVVVTGGALAGPGVLGLGHAPSAPASKVTHPAVPSSSSTASSQVFALPRAASPAPPARDVAEHHRQQPVVRLVDDRSGASSDGHDRSGSTERETAPTVSGDGSSSSTVVRPSGESGTPQQATSDSTRSRTETSDDSSPDTGGSSSATTTTSGSGSGFDD